MFPVDRHSMKKYSLLLLLLLNSIFLVSQTLFQGQSYSLNQPNINPTIYEARDFVELKPGFEACSQSAGSLFWGKINPNLIPGVEYIREPVTNDRQLNTTLPVGSINGSFNVSLVGSANYTIPLIIPPGSNGMTPNLSLEYSSSIESSEGILSRGWKLGGISEIQRVHKTISQDGFVDGVNLDSEDRFSIDGDRLISISGSYGQNGSVYHTEIDSYSKITSLGQNGQGPDSFIVETKDGLKIYYGGTADSKLTISDENGVSSVYKWLKSRIVDPLGNYVDFKYITIYQQVYLDEISYTGNTTTTLSPYNTIKFYYGYRSDPNYLFLLGNKLENKLLLTEIRMFNESQLAHKYKFDYIELVETVNICSLLNTITEFGSDDSHYNSTVFNYGNTRDFLELEPQTYTLATNYNSLPYKGTGGGTQVFIGDFNGDGISDYVKLNDTFSGTITTPTGHSHVQGSAILNVVLKQPEPDNYLSIHYQTFVPILPSPFSGGFYTIPWLKIIDFNGDKMDDIIFEMNNFDPDHSCKLYALISKGEGGYNNYFNFIDLSSLTGIGEIPSLSTIKTGDINGDKKQEVILIKKLSFTDQECVVIADPGIILGSFNTHCESGDFYSLEYYFRDFTGDGKDELMLSDVNNSRIFKFESPDEISQIFNSSEVTFSKEFCLGDFNGDNITDLLVQDGAAWKVWYVTKNNAFEKSPVVHNSSSPPPYNWTQDDIFVKDFNGDHKCDIFEVIKTEDNVRVTIMYGVGNGQFISNYLTLPYPQFNDNASFFHPGDFNGDGKSEISFNKFYMIDPPLSSEPPYEDDSVTVLIKLPLNYNKGIISTITNGLNNTLIINSLSLNSTNIAQGEGHSILLNHVPKPIYPISTITSSRYFVKSILIKKCNNLSITKNYLYEDALFDNFGRGFLGFKKVIEENSTGDKMETEFVLAQNNLALLPKYNRKYDKFGSLLADQEYYFTTATNYPGVFLVSNRGSRTSDYLNDRLIDVEMNYEPNDNLKYGNPSKIITTFTRNSEEIIEIKDFEYKTAGAWCPSVVSLILTTYRRNNVPDIQRKKIFDYFSNGLLKTMVDNPDLSKKLTTSFSNYDAFGNCKTISISASGIESRTYTLNYDIKGRHLIKITNPLNQSVQYEIENKYGNRTKVIDENSLATNYLYDQFGRLLKTTYPSGTFQSESWMWDNNVVLPNTPLYHDEITQSGLLPLKIYYDFGGRKIREVRKDFDGNDLFREYQYNVQDLMTGISEPSYTVPVPPDKWINYSYDDPIYRCTDIISQTIRQKLTYRDNSISILNQLTNQNVVREFTAKGELVQVKEQDDANTISYQYNSAGQIIQVDVSGSVTTMEYDEYGNQQSLNDPDAGESQYGFNAMGLLTTQTDNKGVTTTLLYDKLGRILEKSNPIDGLTHFTYDLGTKGIGKISSITGNNGISTSFQYDQFGRPFRQTEIVDGFSFANTLHYNPVGQVDQLTYPSGFSIKQQYYNGYMTEIRRGDNNQLIYKNEGFNEFDQIERYIYGNNIATDKTYNPTDHILEEIKSYSATNPQSIIMNYEYDHNPDNFQISERRDVTRNLEESFQYDPVYQRLTGIIGGGGAPSSTIKYAANGNIESLDGRAYQYSNHGGGIHAVSCIFDYLAINQNVTYTSFNKVNQISQGSSSYEIVYGPDEARKKSTSWENGFKTKTKYYLGNYEKVVKDDVTEEYHYISATDGLTAVYIKKSNLPATMYYVHKDHLGSIVELSDENGERMPAGAASFDAWGNRRDPETWQPFQAPPQELLFGRGFTGHEHLEPFNLINMNGRCYDPAVARFLSPDNLNPDPAFSQSYNRYSYCFNNPLNFIDPSGFYPDDSDYDGDQERNGHPFQWTISSEYTIGDFIDDAYNWCKANFTGSVDRDEERSNNLEHESPDLDIREFQVEHANDAEIFQDRNAESIMEQNPEEPAGQGGDALYAIGIGLNAAGFVSSAGEYSNVINGNWRGINGKWNSLEWGGNQWTGARANALSKAGYFKIASRGFFVVGTGISLYQGGDALLNGNYAGAAKSGLDIGMGAFATFGGPPGWIIGGGYFLLDAVGAFDRPMNTTPYVPAMFAVPDNTYVAPRVIFPRP